MAAATVVPPNMPEQIPPGSSALNLSWVYLFANTEGERQLIVNNNPAMHSYARKKN